MAKRKMNIVGSNYTIHYIALNSDKNLNRTDREVFASVEMFSRMMYGYCFLSSEEIISLCRLDINITSFKRSLQTLEKFGFIYRATVPKLSGGKSRRIYVTYNPVNDTVFNPVEGVVDQVPVVRIDCDQSLEEYQKHNDIFLQALERNGENILATEPSGWCNNEPSGEHDNEPSSRDKIEPSFSKNKTVEIRQQNKTLSNDAFFETDFSQHHSKKSEQAATEILFSKQERDITTTTPQIAPAPPYDETDAEPDEIDWNAIANEVNQTTMQRDDLAVDEELPVNTQKQVIQPLLFADDTNTGLDNPKASKGLKSGNKEKLTKTQVEEAFELFYNAYKKKKDRAKAEKAFEKVVNGALPKNVDSRDLFVELLVKAATKEYDDYVKSHPPKDELKHMKYPATWLNERSFVDYLDSLAEQQQTPTTTQSKPVYVASSIDDLTDYYGNKDYD